MKMEPIEKEQDTEPTKVVFRRFKPHTCAFKGSCEIIALFPAETWDGYQCSSYQFAGQHGGADYTHVINVTVPATPEEYEPLQKHLINDVGYKLKIIKKYARPRK